MPTFEIGLPDGRKFEVEAPDQQTAWDALQSHIGGGQQQASDQAYRDLLASGSAASTQFASPDRTATPAPQGPTQGSFRTGAMEGMTGNFLDEISAGMMTPIEMGIDAFQGKPLDPGRSYQQAYERNRASTQQAEAADPMAFGAGSLTGALVTGGQVAKGGKTLLAGAKPAIGSMAGRGAAEGALYGAVYGAGEDGSLQDRAGSALTGAAWGGALGGATGAIGGAIASKGAPKKAPTPELDDLYRAKDQAYQTVDQLGARYSQQGIDDLTQDMITRASADNISPTRHPKAYDLLADMQNRRQPMTLTQLDQMRQEIRRDLLGSADDAERHFGGLFIDAIDDFIEKAGPGQISGVTGQTADFAIKTARKANRTLKASEVLEEVFDSARRRVQSTGSGGNIDNALRQSLNKIIDSKKLSRSFTREQLDLMRDVVDGKGRGHDLLRRIGKLSPSGNGLMAMLGIGGTAMNPAMASVPIAGMAAKSLSDQMTKRGVESVVNTVRSGTMPTIPTGGAIPAALGATMPAQGLTAPMALPQLPAMSTNRQR